MCRSTAAIRARGTYVCDDRVVRFMISATRSITSLKNSHKCSYLSGHNKSHPDHVSKLVAAGTTQKMGINVYTRCGLCLYQLSTGIPTAIYESLWLEMKYELVVVYQKMSTGQKRGISIQNCSFSAILRGRAAFSKLKMARTKMHKTFSKNEH